MRERSNARGSFCLAGTKAQTKQPPRGELAAQHYSSSREVSPTCAATGRRSHLVSGQQSRAQACWLQEIAKLGDGMQNAQREGPGYAQRSIGKSSMNLQARHDSIHQLQLRIVVTTVEELLRTRGRKQDGAAGFTPLSPRP
jgi:hypothetical protein